LAHGKPRGFWHCLRIAVSVILALCVLPGGSRASPLAETPPPYVSCEAAILMEWQSGAILAQHNAFRRMYPASITKMMTALLALENGRLEEYVEVSPEAANQPGSSMYLSSGDVFTLEDLLYGLMLNSGNDAAWAIAEHIGGDAETFFDMMNRRAQEIGAINTRYRNPHGLTDPNHYTTAFDLALIARTCLRHPYFRSLVATKEKDVLDATEEVRLQLANTNRLLWVYLGADGVKTGTTESAGQCLVASATRDGMRLLAVVLNSADRWSDAARLLDYGFTQYRVEKALSAGETVTVVPALGAVSGQVALRCATDLWGCVPKDAPELSLELEVPDYIKAPCPAGATVGRALLQLGDSPAGSADLVAAEWVNRRTPAGDLVRALGSVARRLIRLGAM
jgi:D-alanyl-D-alanine carboxypeptidase (penicillin-binding protein 5/6)